MPSFIGSSVSKAETFANNNNLKMTIEYLDDPNEIAGIILKQSVAAGTLTNQISGFTIYVNNPTPKEPDEEDEPIDDEEENNEDENNNLEDIPGNPTEPDDEENETNDKEDENEENDSSTSDNIE